MKANHKSILIIMLTFLGVLHLTDIDAQQYQFLPDSNASWLVQESYKQAEEKRQRHNDNEIFAA